MPAVLEQRVYGKDAFRAWRLLVDQVRRTRARAGAGAHAGAADRRGVAAHPVVGVPPAPTSTPAGRARSSAARSGPTSLERLVSAPAESARAALTSLPGVGVWTAAETAQRAFGDADALSVGDYHLAKVVGWTPARPSHRRRRDGRAARAAASAPAPRGAAARSQRAGAAIRGSDRGGRSRILREM